MSKITFFTQIYEPDREAYSKEIKILAEEFNGKIINLHSYYGPKSLAKIKFSSKLTEFCSILPLKFLLKKYDKRIRHVFGNENNIFNKQLSEIDILTIVTSDIKKQPKAKNIVVESNMQKNLIKNSTVIYPGINLKDFTYHKPNTKVFTVGFASSPMRDKYYENRGVYEIIKAAKELPNVNFILFWRKKASKKIHQLVEEHNLRNIRVVDEIIQANQLYSNVHATIAPFTTFKDNKACPNSIIESIASGKPVIVSKKVGIQDLIIDTGCGVVNDNLAKGIKQLQKDYEKFQKNCKIAAKEFAIEKFIKSYKQIYDKLRA